MLSLLALLGKLETEEERSAVAYLYEKYRNLLYHIAHDILHDTGLAEDITHQTFVNVIKVFHKVGDPDSARTKNWLATIARNLAINERNHRSKQPVFWEDLSTCVTPERSFGMSEKLFLKECIKSLPILYRDALYLVSVMGFTYSEISQQLGLPEATIRKRYQRAKDKLAEMLQEGGCFDEKDA